LKSKSIYLRAVKWLEKNISGSMSSRGESSQQRGHAHLLLWRTPVLVVLKEEEFSGPGKPLPVGICTFQIRAGSPNLVR